MLTNSRAQAERTLELVERGVTPAAQGDEAIAAVASGEASVAAAEADLRRAEEALGPAAWTIRSSGPRSRRWRRRSST